jgi:cell division protein FtsI/penicillin-binding protein 2
MPASSPLKSMFLRRLVLIMGVAVFGMSVLSGQIWRLTVAHGAALREQAEAKLVARDWIPTSRGKILDRKGRVLAQDRPSFDIAVEFSVISGEWAVRKASTIAKAEAGSAAWAKLAREQRQERIDQYIPIFQQHLERMWAVLAQAGGLSEGKLLERRVEIEQHITAMARWLSGRSIGREIQARLAAGDEITADVEEELIKKFGKPIREERAPHVVLPSVADPVGFELRRLADQSTDLVVALASGGTKAVNVPLMPGLTVIDGGDREYPFERVQVDVDLSTLPGPLKRPGSQTIFCEGVAYHLLGRMKESAQAEDNNRRREHREADAAFRERVLTPVDKAMPRRLDRGEYQSNDPAGTAGIEASQEDELRGLRGLHVQRLDTGAEETIDASPGRDVRLTLDVLLQARVQAAMSRELGLALAQPWQHADHPENATVPDGTFLSGAAVVLDVDSADILAMVSSPTIPRSLLRDNPDTVFKNPLNEAVDMPWFNRCVSRPYPPGSIVKAIMLNAAVKLGRHNLDVPIECNGHLYPSKPDQYRCWIFKQFQRTHGPLTAPDALMVSCNIYFFTVGQRLGPEGIVQAYRMFGVGDGWGLGVGAEFPGSVGTFVHGKDGSVLRDSSGRPQTAPPSPADATQMGIGQGPVEWTPLHAADAYATLARGGVRMKPHLVDSGSMPETTELGLDPRAVKAALEGLSKSVNQREGTGNHIRFGDTDEVHFNCPGVQVWGKTGTAEAPTIKIRQGDPLYAQATDDEKLPPGVRALRRGDHSWFVVLVGKAGEDRPRYAISVMMEYAGSGGKVSGPIVNQIIHALRREGYL